ncbi:hypothetical protein QAD02_011255 [Eretmocerus hayati]|uniref:Uncharacterized protein n=1 Tax=Eretmocerus hayati TaxID=131215 RepID=A0ACC2NYS2_9HYME|nr:hypothetical protein QAD02_011255 [Eretmocerus hayati]
MISRKFICIASLALLVQFGSIFGFPSDNERDKIVETDFPENLRDERILGGIGVTVESFPFMVSIMYYGRHLCGGTIYSKDIILTAAHCVEARWIKMMQIRTGTVRSDKGGNIYNVTKVSHPSEYIHWIAGYDIAILRVEPSIEFHEKVSPVEIFNWTEKVGHKREGATIGWGLTKFPSPSAFSRPSPLLQFLKVWAYSPEYCYERYNVQGPKQFCTWAGNKTACSGDSGGPFLVKTDGKWRQAGVYSSSKCHLNKTEPMLWAEVAAHVQWIEEESFSLLTPTQLPYTRKPFSTEKREYFHKNRGTEITPSDAPWTVAIMSATYQDFECSGAIVHSQHVLTAASCVSQDGKHLVYAGSGSPKQNQIYNVIRVFQHPNYHKHSDNTPVNDIAVLRVDRTFEFSDHVSQIVMAAKDEQIIRSKPANMYFWQFEVDRSGHGENMLYSLPIEMKAKDECNGIYEQSREGYLPEKQICGSNYIGMCMELKGGPLVIEDYSQKRLLGIYTWKKFCEDNQFPNVFTELSPYRTWIEARFTDWSDT